MTISIWSVGNSLYSGDKKVLSLDFYESGSLLLCCDSEALFVQAICMDHEDTNIILRWDIFIGEVGIWRGRRWGDSVTGGLYGRG